MWKTIIALACLCLPIAAFAQTETATTTDTNTITATVVATSPIPQPAATQVAPSTATTGANTTTATKSTIDTEYPEKSQPGVASTTDTGTATATSTGTMASSRDLLKLSNEDLQRLLELAPHLGLKSGKMTCQLATAVSAVQLNLKYNDWERVALMLGWGCNYRGTVPVGANIYGGLGLSKNHPNAGQINILFNAYDWAAIGPGLEIFKDPAGNYVEQWLITIALNLNIGASTDTLLKILAAITGAQ
jgi:hypothetical protein